MEKFLKKLLKMLKLNESTISMFLGLAVVLIVGGMIVNYLKNKPAELPTLTDQDVQIVDEADKAEYADTPAEALPPFKGDLPSSYQVRAGDNLWKIAERYYQTGYAWKEIADANGLENGSVIEKGENLVIPQLSKAYPLTVKVNEPAIGGGESTTAADLVANSVDSQSMEGADQDAQHLAMIGNSETESRFGPDISGDTYTVVKGDHLWGIADRAYHDGYKWVEIAKLNELKNPGLIVPGEVLKLPR